MPPATDPRIVALVESEGTAWAGLTLWPDPDEDDDVLRGSSALAPRLSPAAAQALLDHCCQALTALRHDVPGAEWDVALDHVPITWDDSAERYVTAPEHLEHYRQSMAWEAGPGPMEGDGDALVVDVGIADVGVAQRLGHERLEHRGVHAHGHVALHPSLGPVPNRAQVQEVLEDPEAPLDRDGVAVGQHHLGGGGLGGREVGEQRPARSSS